MPQLSVIIASHNREELLRRCLESLRTQTAEPGSFEVIVADDGSDDGSAAMAETLDVPYPLQVLRLSKRGHGAAQNAAMEHARAARCLLLDDDMIASSELVEAHIAAEAEDPDSIGIGPIEQVPMADDWFAETYVRGWADHYADLADREARWSDCYGANISFPTAAFREIGGVSTDIPLAKDFDLALRLRRAGCRPLYLPRAHGVHDDRKKGSDRIMANVRRAGEMHVELGRRYPEAASELLNWVGRVGPRQLALRRVGIALHVPPAPLLRLGRFLPGPGRKTIWLHFVGRLAFWQGVRREVGRESWKAITAGRVDEAVAEGLR